MTRGEGAVPLLRPIAAALSVVLTAAVSSFAWSEQTEPSGVLRELRPVTDDMLQNPPPEAWLSYRRTLDGWAFSPLDEIHTGNVERLREVWSTPLEGGFIEATPIAHDGVLFVPLSEDRIVALDAATGEQLWRFAREYPEGITPGDIKRNVAIYEDRIITTTVDGALLSLDARTGEIVWEVQLTGFVKTSSGPIIADGKVISGRGCEPGYGPEGCVIIANDARTGEELWRTWTMPRPGEPGDETWGGVPWEERNHLGAWIPPSYDPELGLLYIGTSSTTPMPKYLLGGVEHAHLYQTSTLALDAETGEIVWYYQHIQDHWDLDHVFERILVDTAVAPDPNSVSWINPNVTPGEQRRVVTGIPGKIGIVYTLDRETGEFLWAEPTVKQTIILSIDGETGEPQINEELVFTGPDQVKDLCPAFTGGKNWPPGAYSPKTGFMYMPVANLCSTVTSAGPESGEGLLGMAINYVARLEPGETEVGQVRAISVSTGKTEWMFSQRVGVMGIVATGGDLVFVGDVVGRFRAFNAQSGDVLWEKELGGAVSGVPISFGLNGKQYVAVATGPAPEAMGLGRLTPEVRPGTERRLHVFALE